MLLGTCGLAVAQVGTPSRNGYAHFAHRGPCGCLTRSAHGHTCVPPGDVVRSHQCCVVQLLCFIVATTGSCMWMGSKGGAACTLTTTTWRQCASGRLPPGGVVRNACLSAAGGLLAVGAGVPAVLPMPMPMRVCGGWHVCTLTACYLHCLLAAITSAAPAGPTAIVHRRRAGAAAGSAESPAPIDLCSPPPAARWTKGTNSAASGPSFARAAPASGCGTGA
jgi:hypothetical protein